MAIKLKNKNQIDLLRAGGKILAKVMARIIKEAKVGANVLALNDLAEKLIKEFGGRPSFKGYQTSWSSSAYPSALCVSINNEVVHGMANDRILQDGDIVGFDCGLEYRGYFTDMAKTIMIGRVSKEAKKLTHITEEALMLGIKKIKPGIMLSEISKAIQNHVEKNGFSVVRQLVGHGVGFAAHEDPPIPNYYGANFSDLKLQPGMVLAIEPMVNAGDWPVETLDDGWTVVTKDHSLSAHFEHTVAVTEKNYEILTK